MEELIAVITNVGFPIAITVYLLVRFDGLMNQVVKSQEKMTHAIEVLCDKIEKR